MPIYAYGIKRNPLFWQGNKIGKAYRNGTLVYQSFQWAQAAFTSMSSVRDYMAAAAVPNGNVILVAGGSTTGSDYLSLVERFTEAGVRSTVNALSRAVYHLAGAGNGSKAFFGGGGYSSLSNTSNVNMYDSAGVRTSVTSLYKSVRGNRATSLGSYVIFGGGRISALSGQTAVADAYDQNGARTRMSDLAVEAYESGAASTTTHAIFGFGWDRNSWPTYVTLYNTSLVRTATTNGLYGRQGVGTARSGNGVLFAGGYYSTSQVRRDTVEHFDTSAVRTLYPALSVAKNNAGAAYINGKTVVFGGSSTSAVCTTVEVYNDSGVKEASRAMQTARYMVGVPYDVLNGTLYIFGGRTTSSVYLNTAETISYK
jgi:hypothetical protein